MNLKGFLSDVLGIQIQDITDIQVVDRHLGRGFKEGKAELLIEVVFKKLDKKKTVEEIVDILEQDIEYIRTIADLRELHPDYSTIELAKELVANK